MDTQKILVVDDDREILFSLSKLLEYDGFEVVQARDGIEALEQLEKEKPDLILLDIMMPRLDGISALMKIREKNHLPVRSWEQGLRHFFADSGHGMRWRRTRPLSESRYVTEVSFSTLHQSR